jgi:hypothetical protein
MTETTRNSGTSTWYKKIIGVASIPKLLDHGISSLAGAEVGLLWDIILMVVAKASGDMMFFVVVLLEEALFSIDNVGGRSRWSSHDGRGGQRRWPSCSEQRQSNAPKGWDKSGAARKDTRDLGFGL